MKPIQPKQEYKNKGKFFRSPPTQPIAQLTVEPPDPRASMLSG